MALSPSFFFFFNDTATTEIYTLSLHDALPICDSTRPYPSKLPELQYPKHWERVRVSHNGRSEEHTSELQSHSDLVCRLLLEKKKKRADSPVQFQKKNFHSSHITDVVISLMSAF